MVVAVPGLRVVVSRARALSLPACPWSWERIQVNDGQSSLERLGDDAALIVLYVEATGVEAQGCFGSARNASNMDEHGQSVGQVPDSEGMF